MKKLVIIFISLIILKLVSFTIKQDLKPKQAEVETFILYEINKKQEDFDKLIPLIKYLTKINAKEISDYILNQDSSIQKLTNFDFTSVQNYYYFLKENSELNLPNVKVPPNSIPDTLKYLISELQAANILANLYNNKNWDKQAYSCKIKGMIDNIKDLENSIEINITPLIVCNYPEDDKYINDKIIIEPGFLEYDSVPIYYSGELKNVSYVVKNPVTDEEQRFSGH
ncbi:MAG TPA: hypothetical protein VFG10_21005 [Saprospiraceae bacterium]|nr:hypothetical protein [Saprospiraceae bacterium]